MLDAKLFGVWYQIMVLLLPKGSLSLLVDEEEEKELGFVCPWSVLYRYTGPCEREKCTYGTIEVLQLCKTD